jgi:hypothetical protein
MRNLLILVVLGCLLSFVVFVGGCDKSSDVSRSNPLGTEPTSGVHLTDSILSDTDTIWTDTIPPYPGLPDTIWTDTIPPDPGLPDTVWTDTIPPDPGLPDTVWTDTIPPDPGLPDTIWTDTIPPDPGLPDTIWWDTIPIDPEPWIINPGDSI